MIFTSDDAEDKQDRIENVIATIGDCGLIVHDWIYTEKHLSACLLLPVALDSIKSESTVQELEMMNKRAKRYKILM